MKLRSISAPFASLVVAIAAATLFSAVLTAQDLRARLQGALTDASQAVILAAKVTLRNVNTGESATRLTNAAGQYVFDAVSPGTYTVTIEMDGFRRFEQENILVQTPMFTISGITA